MAIRSGVEQAANQWMESLLEKRRRSESQDPQAPVPASELPTQNSLAKGFSTAQCRQDNPPDSRCTSGCCSDCANPTCPFPRGSMNPGRPHPEFRVCDNKAVCRACHSFYSRTGVMGMTPKEVISFHVAKCREDNPSGSRCTSSCCSNCANPTCPFPRGTLRSDSNQVHFSNIEGQIVCINCAVSYNKHGTWRSEATVSEAQAARSLRMRLVQPARQRLKHQMKELALAYGPTKTGESAWCDLSCLLLLLHQKPSITFDCVVFRKASSLRSC